MSVDFESSPLDFLSFLQTTAMLCHHRSQNAAIGTLTDLHGVQADILDGQQRDRSQILALSHLWTTLVVDWAEGVARAFST